MQNQQSPRGKKQRRVRKTFSSHIHHCLNSSQTNRMIKRARKKNKTHRPSICTSWPGYSNWKSTSVWSKWGQLLQGTDGSLFGTGFNWLLALKISAISVFSPIQRQCVCVTQATAKTKATHNSCKHHRLPQPSAPCMPWNHTHLIYKSRHLLFAQQHNAEMKSKLCHTSSCSSGRKKIQEK